MQIDERLFPVGSYWFGYSANLSPEQLLGFGTWEMMGVRNIVGKYLYKRTA